ncbi:guanylate cyclase soluble subunit beta-2-like [Patiria miniata]|uniref:guanylate cyclase n=1 Tax=Patiria miniata TaxID=46514 RepID=A0A914AQS6_PATMI|nr:guanylate cyclase soluble subunit beta-2-like [Patiria miniata]
MYGLIQICLKDLVLERFGESTWDTIRKNAGVEDKFVNFQQYDDDVTYRLAEAAAKLLGVDTDTVYELFGVFWVTWTMRIGYDKLICTLGKNLAEFISNLDFMHTVYMKTMYPMMEEPSFRAETRQDGSLTLHYFSVRHGLNGVVSGVIKGVSRIIFRERIDMDVIEYKEEYHRGVRKDHWVFHVRFVEFNLPAMGVDGKVSQEEWLSILVNEDKGKTSPTKDQTPDILAEMDGHQDAEFSAKIPDKLLIDPSTFIHSFPYHVVFDRHLVIQHCGVKVQQFCPRVTEEGAGLEDFLSIRHPNIALTIENLRSFRTSIFIVDFKKEELRSDMQDKPTISLRGQMVWMDSEQKMVFLCSPRLTKLEDLTERGLHFSDIAPHDITRDLILFNQQRIAEVELSKQLEQKKEELRLLMRDLAEEKKKTDTLLYSMLPREVANELREGRHVQAGEFPQVTILFSDVVHFTDMCSQCQPIQIVHLLNAMYTRFDQLTNVCGVYKVETIGDAYMVVGGLPVETDAHAQRVARFGLQQLKASCEVLSPINGEPIQIRIGIHTGPVVAGVVGLKMPRYCLFGDTVNTASRMESTGMPGKVHTSEAVVRAVENKEDGFIFSTRGDIEVKGKGKMRTYFLCGLQKDEGDDVINTERMIEESPPANVEASQTSEKSRASPHNEDIARGSTVALGPTPLPTSHPTSCPMMGEAPACPAPAGPANAPRPLPDPPSKICVVL